MASNQLPPPPVSAGDGASTSGIVPAASVSVSSSAPVVVTSAPVVAASSAAPTLRVVRLSDLQVTVDNMVARALASRTPPVMPAPRTPPVVPTPLAPSTSAPAPPAAGECQRSRRVGWVLSPGAFCAPDDGVAAPGVALHLLSLRPPGLAVNLLVAGVGCMIIALGFNLANCMGLQG